MCFINSDYCYCELYKSVALIAVPQPKLNIVFGLSYTSSIQIHQHHFYVIYECRENMYMLSPKNGPAKDNFTVDEHSVIDIEECAKKHADVGTVLLFCVISWFVHLHIDGNP